MLPGRAKPTRCNESLWGIHVCTFRFFLVWTSFTVTALHFQFRLGLRQLGSRRWWRRQLVSRRKKRLPMESAGRFHQWWISRGTPVGGACPKARAKILFSAPRLRELTYAVTKATVWTRPIAS